MTWMKGWPPSSQMFLQLLEDVVYGTMFSGTLRNAVKNSKTPQEVMAYPSVKERLATISQALTSEGAVGGINEKQPSQDNLTADEKNAKGSGGQTAAEANTKVLGDDAGGIKQHWRHVARRFVESFVTLIAIENVSETQLSDRLRVASIKAGSAGNLVCCCFDSTLCSEAITAPEIRGTPFQPKVYAKAHPCASCSV